MSLTTSSHPVNAPGYGDRASWPVGTVSPEDEDDSYTLDDADSDATDEIMATGYCIALAIGEHGCIGETVITPDEVLADDEYHAIGRPLHELLAVLLNGPDASVLAVVRELRDIMPALMSDDIESRAAELFFKRNGVAA